MSNTVIIFVIVIIILTTALASRRTNVQEAYRDTICVTDTSLIHDKWVNEYFRIQRGKGCKHIYGDTITMHAKTNYEICYISPHKRIVTLFTRNSTNTSMTVELSRYVENQQSSIVNVWARTLIEKNIAKIIFASTLPDVKITISMTDNPLSQNGIYCFLIDLHDPILDYVRSVSTTLVTYDNIDMAKATYFLPFLETSMVDVASIFNTKSVDGQRTSCISFTYCLWSMIAVKYSAPVKQDIQGIEKVGFFDQFFNVSSKLIKAADDLYSNRLPIEHEEDVSSKHTLIFKDNDYMVIRAAHKDLPKGFVWVEKETHTYENAYPSRVDAATEIKEIKDNITIVTLNNVPLPYYLVYFRDIKVMGRVIKRNNDNTTSVLIRKNNPDKDMYLSKYSCVTNNKLEFDFQCTEENGDVWDRQCMNDFECPFYDVDIGRGGCMETGFCEMPIGVKSIGFRKYDENTKPFCEGCKDKINNPYCCNANANAKYAFPSNLIS